MHKQLMVAAANKRGSFFTRLGVLATPLFAPLAQAQTTGGSSTDYSALTEAVDWGAVAVGIITIFAAGAAVIVAFVGGKFLLRAIRGA